MAVVHTSSVSGRFEKSYKQFYEPNSDPQIRQSNYDKRNKYQLTNIHDDDDQSKILSKMLMSLW